MSTMINPMMAKPAGTPYGDMGGVSPAPGQVPQMHDRPPVTPMPPQMHMAQQPGQMVPQQQAGRSIPLSYLVNFIVQRIYHELTVLSELLPRKTDMERKQEIFQFASRSRLMAVRLLALVKWASSAAKVDKSVQIMAFLEKQSLLFVDTADVLARMARETLVHARLPNFHIPAAVEVLTTGTYSRLPTCIRERIVPPDPIQSSQKKTTLLRLNQVIQHRLVTTDLPIQMRNLKIENGRVTFRVENEFEVSVTMLGDSTNIPWKIIEINFLVEDKDVGDGMTLVHPFQTNYIHQILQSRIDNSSTPLKELYNVLHSFSQALQLEVLYSQTLKLCRDRLGEYLVIEEYAVGRSLVLSYWRDLSALDPRAELGYKLTISVDTGDPSQPLGVSHQPTFSGEEMTLSGEGLKTSQLESIIVETVHLRSISRLKELKKTIQLTLSLKGKLQGSPPVLSLQILKECLSSEQLLISVNFYTGYFLVHVPQFEPSPAVVEEIQKVLNSPGQDMEKLRVLLSQLRYWITEKRCEKTLQHLPASASEKITLLNWNEHPILSSIASSRIIIKFQKHPYAIMIVEFKEDERDCCEMDYNFFLIFVKKASAEENEENNVGNNTSAPKFYLKPVTVLPLNSYTCTHGPFTEILESRNDMNKPGKRPLSLTIEIPEVPTKKAIRSAYFIPELAHIVSLCDEKLPFASLSQEFNSREIIHTTCEVEGEGTCLSVNILRIPCTLSNVPASTVEKLHEQLESATLRCQTQLRGYRTWNLEIKFKGWGGRSKVPTAGNPLHYTYDMALSTTDPLPKVIDNMLMDWNNIAKIFQLIIGSNWCRRIEMTNFAQVKSFTWNKIVLAYGPNKAAILVVTYNQQDKCYKLSFGGSNAHNPHTLIELQLQQLLNLNGRLDDLVKLLKDTHEPLYSLTKLPTTPQLGVIFNRPNIPVQTFVLIPQSPTHVRIVYFNVYCIDVHFQSDGLVSIRDGAYSLFDKSQVLGELTPTQGLRAFLSKYVDENAMFRRRSQSEDDNPPSPISTLMEVEHCGLAHTPGASAANTGSPFMVKPQSPAPIKSNPNTPSSPHISAGSTAFSPAFANLASPPSLGHLSQPSPNPSSSMLHHPSPSPSTLHPAPSPSSGPMSVPSASPNPSSASQAFGGPASAPSAVPNAGHPSPFFHADGSPAAAQSPWMAAGSPGMPRPSPARIGHSPQTGASHGDGRPNVMINRVLPSRSWAGAIPTTLTHDALDVLCTPVTSTDGSIDPNSPPVSLYPCRPLERFLGCSYLKRQLHRIVISEEHLHLVNQEFGVLSFRSETMLFRLNLDTNHFQSLHLKISPLPESQATWSPDETQLLENFFATKVASPPFRPNAIQAFTKMISLPTRIIKDCIQIIRLQLVPSIVEQQGWKWHVRICLTVPPSATPIIPQGSAAIVTSQSKILIYLQLVKVRTVYDMKPDDSDSLEADKNNCLVLPLIHDINGNTTQLAEKRAIGTPPEYVAIAQQMKRFAEFNQGNMNCSIFPAVQDLLENLMLHPEQQGMLSNPNTPGTPVGGSVPPGPMGSSMVRPMSMSSPMMPVGTPTYPGPAPGSYN